MKTETETENRKVWETETETETENRKTKTEKPKLIWFGLVFGFRLNLPTPIYECLNCFSFFFLNIRVSPF